MQIKSLKSSYVHICALYFFFIICPFKTMAQQALKKGESIPDIVIHQVYNYQKKEIELKKINRKLILFDFWSPSCTGCLKSFSKMDSLQRMFKDEIRIIMVNRQSFDSTRRFFETRKFLFKPKLPFATSDTILNRLFPNMANPAYAWVDGTGKFHQMTNDLTAVAIRKFIAENRVSLGDYQKKRIYVESLFDKNYEPSVISYSYLSKAISGVNLSGLTEKHGLSSHDYGILDLYREAFGELGKYDFSKKWKIILEVRDTNRFIPPTDPDAIYEWYANNTYNYSLRLPESTATQRFTIMRSELDRYFGIEAHIEKRLLNSLILVKVGSTDRLKSTKTGPSNFTMSDLHSTNIEPVRKLINRPYQKFSEIIGNWIEYRLDKPFLDETGYTGNVDMELDGNTVDRFDLRKIKRALQQYGLDIIEEKRPIDVLVLKEK